MQVGKHPMREHALSSTHAVCCAPCHCVSLSAALATLQTCPNCPHLQHGGNDLLPVFGLVKCRGSQAHQRHGEGLDALDLHGSTGKVI